MTLATALLPLTLSLTVARAASAADTDPYAFVVPSTSTLVNAVQVKTACENWGGTTGKVDLHAACTGETNIAWLARVGQSCALTRSAKLYKYEAKLWPASGEATSPNFATSEELILASTGECAEAVARPSAGEGGTESAARSTGSIINNALWGVTDLLIENAWSTVEGWLAFQKLNRLCEPSDTLTDALEPAKILPGLCAIAGTVQSPSELYAAGDELEAAVKADALALPRNVAEELLEEEEAEQDSRLRDALVTLAVTGRVLELSQADASPTEALGAWAASQPASRPGATDQRISWDDEPLSSGLYIVSLSAASLPPSAVFVDRDRLLKTQDLSGSEDLILVAMLHNLAARKDALPVARERALEGLWTSDPEGVAGLIASLSASWTTLGSAARDAQDAWLAVQTSLTGWSGGKVGPTEEQALRRLSLAMAALLEASEQAVTALAPTLGGDKSKLEALGKTLDQIGTLLEGIGSDDGTKVALASVGFALDRLDKLLDRAEKAAEGGADQKVAPLLSRIALQRLQELLALALGLMEAESPEDAEAALASFAAPPGSYYEKRHRAQAGYLTFNGYVGAGLGMESVDGTRGQAVWPAVSLGPEAGLRLNRSSDHPWTLGLYVPLLDLGTMAMWRLDHEDSSALPEVGLNDVFSPGAWASLGIGALDLPLALQVGASLEPSLRAITEDGLTTQTDAWRLGFNLAVDVPLRR